MTAFGRLLPDSNLPILAEISYQLGDTTNVTP